MSSELELLIPNAPEDRPSFFWGTLTNRNPNRVTIDGDEDGNEIDVSNNTIIKLDNVPIMSRLLLMRQRTRVVVIGDSKGEGGPMGPQGPPGEQGEPGEMGPPGTSGTSATSVTVGNDALVIPATQGGLVAVAMSVVIPFGGWIGDNRAAATAAISALPSGMTVMNNTPATTSANGSVTIAIEVNATLGGAAVKSGNFTLTITCNARSFPVTISWAKVPQGQQGPAGNPGRGITGEVNHYATSSSGTTPPTSGWQTTIPTVTPGNWLWTRVTYSYTDSSTSVTYSVAKAGETGEQGRGVTSLTIFYQLSTLTPSVPTTLEPPSPWTVNEPTPAENENRSLWSVVRTIYSSGTPNYNYSTVNKEAAFEAAKGAYSLANGKITISPNAPVTANGAGKPVGALWMHRVDGEHFADYEWNGTSWVSFPLSETIIPKIAIGVGTYGDLEGRTLVGNTIQTARTGARTEMTTQGIRVLNSSNQVLVQLGYGIATGMAVRDPADGSMVPLAPQIFGSSFHQGSVNISVPDPGGSDGDLGTIQESGKVSSQFSTPTGRALVIYGVDRLTSAVMDCRFWVRFYRDDTDVNNRSTSFITPILGPGPYVSFEVLTGFPKNVPHSITFCLQGKKTGSFNTASVTYTKRRVYVMPI